MSVEKLTLADRLALIESMMSPSDFIGPKTRYEVIRERDLLVAAAPDLLDAAEAILIAFDEGHLSKSIAMIQAAVSKARGDNGSI